MKVLENPAKTKYYLINNVEMMMFNCDNLKNNSRELLNYYTKKIKSQDGN